MTDASDRGPSPRPAPGQRASSRKRHVAAASRLFVGGVAIAGTLELVAVMAAGAETAAVSSPSPPALTATTTPATPATPAPPAAPKTIVVVRRHVIVGSAPSARTTSRTASPSVSSGGGGSAAPAAAPAPAPAPPPPVTTTKGS